VAAVEQQLMVVEPLETEEQAVVVMDLLLVTVLQAAQTQVGVGVAAGKQALIIQEAQAAQVL
jgi:sRNA-binding carbon storage regulator CsrA